MLASKVIVVKGSARTVVRRLCRAPALHRLLAWLAQLFIFAGAGLAAFLLRFELTIPQQELAHLGFALPVWIVVRSISFRLAGLDRGWWRYVSIADVVRIAWATLISSALAGVVIRLAGPPGFPRSIHLLECLLCFLGSAGVRVGVRLMAETAAQGAKAEAAKRTLIYGAGAAGIGLLEGIRRNPSLPYQPVGFIDDDRNKVGLTIRGIKVLGCGEQLAVLARKLRVEMVLIAIPSATGAQMTRILRLCHESGLGYRTVPGVGELVAGCGLARQIREVAVEDLLGRNPVRLEEQSIRAKLEGRVVMVTGAAGSIGSELCRQIARYDPGAIVAYEIAESPLFELERRMRQAFPRLDFRPELGSIQNPTRLQEVFDSHKPSVVYHAAAYKHVPLMEQHVFEAVENNVFGTYNVASLAVCKGVDYFVLISSDKAVRPANVMGATKRLAELVLLSLHSKGTRFVAVRFGNVLGSSGSVVPIFKQQIAAGGPVTVTHPEMRRFFMTTSEAVQLVLQASTMGRGGEIFVLDMGEPVKIVDLARNLILLSGLRPDQDIKLQYTGVRPGEKLYEELSTLLEDTLPTGHEKIRVFAGNGLPARSVQHYLDLLREACRARDLTGVILILKDAIPDYNPSAHLLRRIVAVKPAYATLEHSAIG